MLIKIVFGHVCVFCVCLCLHSNWDCELIKSMKVIWKSSMFPNLLCWLTPYVPTQKLLSTEIPQWVPHVVCWIHNPLTQCLLQQWGSLCLNDTVRAVLHSFWYNFVILNLSTWSAKGARSREFNPHFRHAFGLSRRSFASLRDRNNSKTNRLNKQQLQAFA